MSKNTQDEKQPMTKKQKQAAVVCAVCALALVLTASITGVLVSKRIRADAPDSQPAGSAASGGYVASDYVIDSSAVLAETADAGDEYLQQTLFLGDSNTVRMNKNGLISLQQFCAQEGLGIQAASTEKFVTFKSDDTLYTIPQAVAMLKPRRVVVTLGTNNADGSLSTEEFVAQYKSFLTAVQSSYSYADIIVNAIPPIPASHGSYPNLDQSVIDAYNMALAELCEEMDLKFLNSAAVLKDETGYGNSSYFVENDIHMTLSGLKAMLDYYRTHAYEAEDRRPAADQTAKVPQRAQSFTNSASSSSPTPTASAEVKYTASYFVESGGGGTLTSGSDTGKTSLKFNITDTSDSITVTAVPSAGYVFSKWSDGVTTAARTDTNFKQNVNVTAMFVAVGVTISPSSAKVEPNTAVNFTAAATVGGKESDASGIHWYYKDASGANTDTNKTGSTYTFTPTTAGTYTVYATYTYNGAVVATSAVATVTVETAATAAPTHTPTPTPTPTPTHTPTPPAETPTPTVEPTQEPTPEPPVDSTSSVDAGQQDDQQQQAGQATAAASVEAESTPEAEGAESGADA